MRNRLRWLVVSVILWAAGAPAFGGDPLEDGAVGRIEPGRQRRGANGRRRHINLRMRDHGAKRRQIRKIRPVHRSSPACGSGRQALTNPLRLTLSRGTSGCGSKLQFQGGSARAQLRQICGFRLKLR